LEEKIIQKYPRPHQEAVFAFRLNSVHKEIEHIAQSTAVGFEQLGVPALAAGYCGEFFILDVKKFGQYAAGCADFFGLEDGVFALGAFIIEGHGFSFSLMMFFIPGR
jgi:hypothetical protein